MIVAEKNKALGYLFLGLSIVLKVKAEMNHLVSFCGVRSNNSFSTGLSCAKAVTNVKPLNKKKTSTVEDQKMLDRLKKISADQVDFQFRNKDEIVIVLKEKLQKSSFIAQNITIANDSIEFASWVGKTIRNGNMQLRQSWTLAKDELSPALSKTLFEVKKHLLQLPRKII